MDKRIGRQEPTYRLPQNMDYFDSLGDEAIQCYEATGREAQPWQKLLVQDILSINDDNLWYFPKAGYSVPRRNGKGEVLTIIELYDLENGNKTLHTAHRTTTSSSASYRLAKILDDKGYKEILRPKKGEDYGGNAYVFSKQFGLEKITVLGENGGSVSFRTRTSKGGLGEGYDRLIIDEAQEYTDDQQGTLQYLVSDASNPQIILCGTPPTAVSSGTVFPKLREDAVTGNTEETYWAEWSVDTMTDVNDVETWYACNPAMGFQLNERKIKAEDKTDEVDFNIQRFGLWIKYNQKSAITEGEWKNLAVEKVPKRASDKVVGIKFGKDGTNVALSLAFKTDEGKVFVETYACRPIRSGNLWIVDFLKKANNISKVIVDGANGQALLQDDLKQAEVKIKPIFPSVKEIVIANTSFESALYSGSIEHRAQPSVVQVVTNCEKRTIGNNGGFGYKSIKPDADIAIMDSLILAYWGASELKEKKKQRVNY